VGRVPPPSVSTTAVVKYLGDTLTPTTVHVPGVMHAMLVGSKLSAPAGTGSEFSFQVEPVPV